MCCDASICTDQREDISDRTRTNVKERVNMCVCV